MDTVLMDWIRIGLAAAAFILVAKWLFVGILPIPGLKQAAAAL